jgi:hypothetical protein
MNPLAYLEEKDSVKRTMMQELAKRAWEFKKEEHENQAIAIANYISKLLK